MINLDMIGRITNNRVFVGGVGTSPNYRTMLEQLNAGTGLQLDYSDSGYGSSDHTSFNAKKIPVLFFFSGLHTDYHKPSDTVDKINGDGAVKVASLVYGMMDRVANDNERAGLCRSATAPAARARRRWRLRRLFRIGPGFPRRHRGRDVRRCGQQQSRPPRRGSRPATS